jgi:choline kinase
LDGGQTPTRLRLPVRRQHQGGEITALILSAGRGSRLLPLTERIPKALVEVGGRSILGWQLDSLAAAGVRSVAVVTGFGADLVAEYLAAHAPGGMHVSTVFNPFFESTDNLISCWAAREEMDGDFLLVNGDTLFEPAVIDRLLSAATAPVTVAVRRKAAYDADDMKVECADSVLRRIGKQLPIDTTAAESIGVMAFRGTGPALFRRELERAVTMPEAKRWWYPTVVDRLAKSGWVRVAHVEGLATAEIDVPADIPAAEQVVVSLPGAAEQAVAK